MQVLVITGNRYSRIGIVIYIDYRFIEVSSNNSSIDVNRMSMNYFINLHKTTKRRLCRNIFMYVPNDFHQ